MRLSGIATLIAGLAAPAASAAPRARRHSPHSRARCRSTGGRTETPSSSMRRAGSSCSIPAAIPSMRRRSSIMRSTPPAHRRDRQLALASRPYDRQLGHPPGLSAGPGLREQRAQGRAGHLPRQRKANAAKALADPKTTAAARDQILRGRSVLDHPERIAPNRIVAKSGRMAIAGRMLDVHLARFAASEGDVWIYDPKTRVAIVGDLVVDIVPFMDTACADGWSKALDEVAKVPFTDADPGSRPGHEPRRFFRVAHGLRQFRQVRTFRRRQEAMRRRLVARRGAGSSTPSTRIMSAMRRIII